MGRGFSSKSGTVLRSCGDAPSRILSLHTSHGVPLAGNNFLSLSAGKMLLTFVQGGIVWCELCCPWNSPGRVCMEAMAGYSLWIWAGRAEGRVELTHEHL